MKKLYSIFAAALLLTGALTGCNKKEQITGAMDEVAPWTEPTEPYHERRSADEDVVITEDQTAPFSTVDNSSNIDVVTVPDDEYSVEVQASSQASAEQIVTEVDETGTLQVSNSGTLSSNDPNAVVIVHTPVVRKVNIRSKGMTRMLGNEHYDQLEVNASGIGRVILGGSGTDNLLISQSGIGDIDAAQMPAISVTVTSNGIGRTRVTAQDALQVNINGIAYVYYYGNPTVTQNIHGRGKVVRLQ